MSGLRRYRRRIGTMLAALMLTSLSLGGALAAVNGPDFQFPLCLPGHADAPIAPADTADNGHCELCPLKTPTWLSGPGTSIHQGYRQGTHATVSPALESAGAIGRAELSPLNLRAPPPHP